MKNLKKVIALVAVFAMLVSTVAFAQIYTDVKDEDTYAEAISMLSSLSILTGDVDASGNKVFRPEDTITRAEFAAVVERMTGITSAAQSSTVFTDVPSSHWASGYISMASGAGIVNGYGDGTFGPEDPVTCEQAIKMVMVAIGYEPFAAENGGYPAGYKIAAQRYGVLEGVIGLVDSAAATRGQVAQIVYNAIDTPLMERDSYGSEDSKYIVKDGRNYTAFETLLTRDLGVKKATGIVIMNGVSDGNQIDTSKDEEIKFYFDKNTDDYENYKLSDVANGTVYANGSNAGDLLGREVSVYLEEGKNNREFNILSIAETSKNKILEVNLDDVVGVEGGYFKYYKDENARSTTDVKIDSEADVFFNGVYYGGQAYYANDFFGDKTRSGKVTLIDNGYSTTYNFIMIEIGEAGVVDEVTNSGKVTFKNAPKSADGKKIELIFDEDDETQKIVLKKDGEEIDYRDLQEWDVLSILANDKNDYYVANVISAGKINGTISEISYSDTSYDGNQYRVDGTNYDLASGAYLNGRLMADASGVFYIDNYGKIVAFDKNGSTTASDKYAYILNAEEDDDNWGKESVRVQYLDKSGEVIEAYLADTVKFENAGKVDCTYDGKTKTLAETLGIAGDNGSYKMENADRNLAKAIANTLKNKLITYSLTGDDLKTITFAQNDPEDGSLCLADRGEKADYDEEDAVIQIGRTKYDVDDSVIVFFIDGDNAVYDMSNHEINGKASKTMSKVGTFVSMGDDEYDYAEVYDEDNDVPAVLVLYNTTGGISSSSCICVIDTVGKSTVDGSDVAAVTYWYNGEKMTAYTDEDYTGDDIDRNTVSQGEIWKLAVNGSTITEGRKIAGVERDSYIAGVKGQLVVDVKSLKSKEMVYFGPVTDFNASNKTIRYATINDLTSATDPYILDEFNSLKTSKANVYVVDPARKNNKIFVGDAGDVDFDKDLKDVTGNGNYAVIFKNGGGVANCQALGMFDFVVGYEYDGDVIDVVIYKANDFGRYSIEIND